MSRWPASGTTCHSPFHVLATQNPIEQEGTYPLPEAQLDRFLLEIDVPYPDLDAERRMLFATTGTEEPEAPAGVLDRRAHAGPAAGAYDPGRRVGCRCDPQSRALGPSRRRIRAPIVNKNVAWGPGPRASQALMLGVRARALLDGRLSPSIDDVAGARRARCCATAWPSPLRPAPRAHGLDDVIDRLTGSLG